MVNADRAGHSLSAWLWKRLVASQEHMLCPQLSHPTARLIPQKSIHIRKCSWELTAIKTSSDLVQCLSTDEWAAQW